MTQYEQAMQRLQAYKFELIVTGEQQRQMRRFSGACRFVYNKALRCKKNDMSRVKRNYRPLN